MSREGEEGSDLPNYLLLIGLYPLFACYFSLEPPFAMKIEAVRSSEDQDRRCCQQIEMSASVTNELSAFIYTLKPSRESGLTLSAPTVPRTLCSSR